MIFNKRLLAVVCLASLAFGADPWKGKKPEDWDEKEIKRVLTNSPWAKSSAMDFGSSHMQQGGGRGGWRGGGGGTGAGGGWGGMGAGSAGGGGMGGRAGGGMGGRGGDVGNMDGQPVMERPKVLVRWESAEPVRDAWLKAEEAFHKQLAAWAEQYYVVSTSGMGGGGQPQGDPNWFQNRLKQTTSLTPRGRDAIHPDQVKMVRTPTGIMTIFLFPRSADISMDDHELLFETAMGPMTVKSKFNLSDMRFDGKLAL